MALNNVLTDKEIQQGLILTAPVTAASAAVVIEIVSCLKK